MSGQLTLSDRFRQLEGLAGAVTGGIDAGQVGAHHAVGADEHAVKRKPGHQLVGSHSRTEDEHAVIRLLAEAGGEMNPAVVAALKGLGHAFGVVPCRRFGRFVLGKGIVINLAAQTGKEIGVFNAAVPCGKNGNLAAAVEHAVTGAAPAHALTEQLFFAEAGLPGKVLFSTFLVDFIEYEVELDDGQMLIINEYTKDTTTRHEVGEKVHISFDAARISLYDENEEVLSK